jgi:hypothetical protein
MAALHDGANQKASLSTAGSAFQNARPCRDPKRLRYDAAVWALEAVSPAGAFQIGGASRVIGEKPLELRKGLREGQIVPSMDIHPHHGAFRRFCSSIAAHALPIDKHYRW